MPYLGKRSLQKLSECSWNLQKVVQDAIKVIDFSVICGHRGEVEQNAAVADGNSWVKFPNSKHNSEPANAFDFIPSPFKGWDDIGGFRKVASAIKVVARKHGVNIECGVDWKHRDSGHVQEEVDRGYMG